MKRVVIVGGGYAGVTLAKALDGVLDVVLVERKDRFFHNVGAMRAYADASLFPRLLIPYDRLLRRGRLVQDEMVSAGAGHVELASGAALEADAVVVATGSRYAMPFKSEFRESAAFLREAEAMSARLAEAGRVAILGDGPVAVELAGEVSWRYPKKQLMLVGAAERLLPGAGNPRLGERVLATLRGRGVEVVFGQRHATGADLVIRAYGGAMERVAVDGCLSAGGIYRIGDAADCGEPALSFLARRQARYLARHLKAVLADGVAPERVPAYKTVRHVGMAVPLGPRDGAVQLPFPGLPVFGGWATSRLKGRDLFIPKNWAFLNQV